MKKLIGLLTSTATNRKKINIYKWSGIKQGGSRVKGTLIGDNPDYIHKELKRQNIEPIKIQKQFKFFLQFEKIHKQDIILFNRHLATMLHTGIPLVSAIEILIKGQTKWPIQVLLQSLKNEIASGKTLYETLSLHPQYFNVLTRRFINIGETSGTLPDMFKQVAHYLEKTETLKKQIRKVMYYPTIIIGVVIIVSSLLLLFVIPQFEILFKTFDAQLPLFTRLIIRTSRFFQKNWHFIFGIFGLFMLFFSYILRRLPQLKHLIDSIVLRLPILGNLLKKIIIARILRILNTTLAAGMPLLDALASAESITTNYVYSVGLLRMKEDIAAGQKIHVACNSTSIFPTVVSQTISVAEECGTLEDMLDKMASFYEEEVTHMINLLTTLIEPIIMVLLSTIIGSFVLAMYLPIFRLGALV